MDPPTHNFFPPFINIVKAFIKIVRSGLDHIHFKFNSTLPCTLDR